MEPPQDLVGVQDLIDAYRAQRDAALDDAARNAARLAYHRRIHQGDGCAPAPPESPPPPEDERKVSDDAPV